MHNELEGQRTSDTKGFCRLCQCGVHGLRNLDGENTPIPHVIEFLEVVLGYKFPESSCENCFQEITQFSRFIKKCLDAQNTLQQVTEDHDYVGIDNNKKENPENSEIEENFPGSSVIIVESVVDNPPTNSSIDDSVNTTKNNKSGSKVCDKCGETITALRYHYKTHKQCQPRNAICSECGKTFLHPAQLKLHMRSHLKEDSFPFMCDICSKHFRYENSLRRHLEVHKSSNRFVCEICGKCYTTNLVLQDHLKVHDGPTPFSCRYCDKKFGSRRSRFDHEKKHKPKEIVENSTMVRKKKQTKPSSKSPVTSATKKLP